MKIQVILEPSNEGGFTAIVPSLAGCISEGNTKEEALKRLVGQATLSVASPPNKTAPAPG